MNNRLDEKVKELFTEESVSLLACELNPRRGETKFPGAVMFRPVSDIEVADLLNLDGNRPIILPVAGFFPTPGNNYNCNLRLAKSGKVIYAFPANRRDLMKTHRNEWKPNTAFFTGVILMEKNGDGRFHGRHPNTGQYILPHETLELEATDGNTVKVNMEGKALRPIHTCGLWLIGDAQSIGKVNLATYDEEYAAAHKPAEKPDFRYAKEFFFLKNKLTIFEIAGTPLGPGGKAASSIAEFETNSKNWLDTIERWTRRGELVFALHEDHWPKEWDNEMRTRAHDIAMETSKACADALDWSRQWLQAATARHYRRQAAGAPLRFRTPSAEGRGRKKVALATAQTTEELRERFVKVVEYKKPETAPAAQPEASVSPTTTATVKPAAVSKTTTTPKPATKTKKPAKLANGDHSELTLAEHSPGAGAALQNLKQMLEEEEDNGRPKRKTTSRKKSGDSVKETEKIPTKRTRKKS